MSGEQEQPTVADFRGRLIGRLLDPHSPYLYVRFAILRLLGLVYLVAFLVAALQAVPLLGEDGLMPVPVFLDRVLSVTGSKAAAFARLPTVFWFGFSDTGLLVVSWLGVVLSAALLLGVTNAALQLALWVLYMSIVHVGQRFYGYGWESQLLETGFLSVFLCPLRTIRPFASAPPFVTILLFRWLVFRIMLGAGLIKLRGDECWRDLTCLYYHFETQPIPHQLSPWFHFMPHWAQRAGVVVNHIVEVVAPFFAFGPRPARLVAGVLFIAFQLTLIASGNLSFLNWLTMIPALACFDDDFLRRLGAVPRVVPERLRAAVGGWWRRAMSGGDGSDGVSPRPPSAPHQKVAWGYAFIVGVLSIGPTANLLSSRQAMNRSFDPLDLVNTYGAFGSVTRVRNEVVLEGTADTTLGPDTVWKEYEFPCKPGDVDRAPCWLTPYHSRIDWQMWFAALGSVGREPWLAHLVYKLLEGDDSVAPLIAKNPFADRPPRYIRASFYRYEMVAPWAETEAWWRRERLGIYLPPVSRDSEELRLFLLRRGWIR